jgi:cytochrome c-type biogenesis protein CcmH
VFIALPLQVHKDNPMPLKNRIARLCLLTAFFSIFLLGAMLGGLLPGGFFVASAQDTEPTGPTDDEVNAIAKQLYCPVCENIPLDVCPTQACAQWRDLIREKLAEGWNERQIKDYFVEQYGERVLAAPPARGINWLFYLVPPLAIGAGIYILYRAFLSMRPQPASGTYPSTHLEPPAEDYVRRLEEELRKKD